MPNDYCYWFVCLAPLEANVPQIFGFEEFLTGLALMVLAWTIADLVYRFRIKTAPIPLIETTFGITTVIGVRLRILKNLDKSKADLLQHPRRTINAKHIESSINKELRQRNPVAGGPTSGVLPFRAGSKGTREFPSAHHFRSR